MGPGHNLTQVGALGGHRLANHMLAARANIPLASAYASSPSSPTIPRLSQVCPPCPPRRPLTIQLRVSARGWNSSDAFPPTDYTLSEENVDATVTSSQTIHKTCGLEVLSGGKETTMT